MTGKFRNFVTRFLSCLLTPMAIQAEYEDMIVAVISPAALARRAPSGTSLPAPCFPCGASLFGHSLRFTTLGVFLVFGALVLVMVCLLFVFLLRRRCSWTLTFFLHGFGSAATRL